MQTDEQPMTDQDLAEPTPKLPGPFSICVRVTEKALATLLEQSADGSGAYRDAHPWIVAHRLWQDALAVSQSLPLLFSAGDDIKLGPEFAYWGLLTHVDLVELHRSSWQTRAQFDHLRAVHPIFTSIDSVFMQPTAEQYEREAKEDITQQRQALTVHALHPYAIVETPAYIVEALLHN